MNEKLKIAHLTSVHNDRDVRIFIKQCVSLAKAGHEVFMVIPNSESRIEQDVHVISFEHKPKRRIGRMITTVNRVYQRAVELDADIYHLHDPELLRIGVKLRKKGKRVVYDAHEDLPRQILAKTYIPSVLRKVVSRIFERYENRLAGKMSGVVAATPFIRDRFLKVNPTTVDVNNYPIISELTVNMDYSEKEGSQICYVGGMTRVRGIVEVIKAMEKTNATLLLAGKFLEAGLREEVARLEGWKQVAELGFLSRSEVKNVYIRSKLGLVTLYPIVNYLDALPVKMFEYMAAGLPVVASNFELWNSILHENNAGICVDPKDPEAIANAINFVLDNPLKAKEMGENGKKLVQEKYNWEIEKQKLFELYRKIS